MGFVEDSIQAINRGNPLPERWDRVGGMGGENFTTLPENGVPYSYDLRAIPYLENPAAWHTGEFFNDTYFEVIDAIRNQNLERLNEIVVANGKKPISSVDFDDMIAEYTNFQHRALQSVGNIDATYGLKGIAAPWRSSTTGEILLKGGAEQIITPLSGSSLMDLGVLSKY